MAHQRIRKFNTKDTYPDQDLDNDLCQVVRAGNTGRVLRLQDLAPFRFDAQAENVSSI